MQGFWRFIKSPVGIVMITVAGVLLLYLIYKIIKGSGTSTAATAASDANNPQGSLTVNENNTVTNPAPSPSPPAPGATRMPPVPAPGATRMPPVPAPGATRKPPVPAPGPTRKPPVPAPGPTRKPPVPPQEKGIHGGPDDSASGSVDVGFGGPAITSVYHRTSLVPPTHYPPVVALTSPMPGSINSLPAEHVLARGAIDE